MSDDNPDSMLGSYSASIYDSFHFYQLLSKQCSKDIQNARADERRLANKEIDSVRTFFLEREEQTTEDLSELEKLHTGRYILFWDAYFSVKLSVHFCHTFSSMTGISSE